MRKAGKRFAFVLTYYLGFFVHAMRTTHLYQSLLGNSDGLKRGAYALVFCINCLMDDKTTNA